MDRFLYRHGRVFVKGAASLLLLASMTVGTAQISPGGLRFFGDRVVRETVPSAAPIAQVSCMYYGTVALRADGTVIAWGDGTFGRMDLPPDLADAVQIATGKGHGLALRADGTVVAWGINDVGQCNVPAGLANVRSVWAGDNMSFAIRNDGSCIAWGSVPPLPNGIDLSGVVQFAAGEGYALALRANGTVVGWGTNGLGESTPPAGLTGVVQIRCGRNHALALRSDGTVVAWGDNGSGQRTVPAGLSGVVAIGAGYAHSVAVKADGTFVGWGYNGLKQCNPPLGTGGLVDVAAAGSFSVARKADGTLVAFGESNFNQTSIPNLIGVNRIGGGTSGYVGVREDGKPAFFSRDDSGQAEPPLAVDNPRMAFLGVRHGIALLSAGTVAAWGSNQDGQCAVPGSLNNPVQVAAGRFHSGAVTSTGSIYLWGSNVSSQCTVPANLGPVTKLALGYEHSAALRADGTVAVWGDNWYGQRNIPAGLSGVIDLAAGMHHTIALKGDGSVVGWGWNVSGQCSPPASLTNAVAIAAGDSHSLALRADGTVVGWGDDQMREISPLASLGGVAEVAASGFASAALMKMHVAVAPYLIVGGTTGKGTIHLAAPAPAGGLEVSLGSDAPDLFTVPPYVTVPAGARTVDFPITAEVPVSARHATVRASIEGLVQRCLVTVAPAPFGFTLTRSVVVGGSTTNVQGTIKVAQAAPAGGLTFDVLASDAALSVPAHVTIAAGKTSAVFTVGHVRVSSAKSDQITVSHAGFSMPSGLTVQPFALASFTTGITSQFGGLPIPLAFKLNAAPAAPLAIDVSASLPSIIPGINALVPAGVNNGTVDLPTKPVAAANSVSVTSTVESTKLTRTVKIYPGLTSASIAGTLYGNGTVDVTVNCPLPAPAGGLPVAVATTHCIAPATVTIPEGAKTVTFSVRGEDVSKSTGATISLSALGTTLNLARTDYVNPVKTMVATPTTIAGNSPTPVNITLTLASKVAVDTPVSLTSGSSTYLSVPATVIVPAGSDTVTVAAAPHPTTLIRSVKITATRLGIAKYVTVTVTP